MMCLGVRSHELGPLVLFPEIHKGSYYYTYGIPPVYVYLPLYSYLYDFSFLVSVYIRLISILFVASDTILVTSSQSICGR